MIYVYGSNFSLTYNRPHSEPIMQRDLVAAFNTIGRPAVAVWGGESGIIEGVPHAHIHTLDPSPDDILFMIHGLNGALVAKNPGYANLRQMRRRLLYTSVEFPESSHPGVMSAWGQFYQHIFLECAAHVPAIQSSVSPVPVEHCQLGCTLDVDLSSLPDPYLTDGKHLFFAGRLVGTSLDRLQRLIAAMPSDMHVWVAASVTNLSSQSERWPGCTVAVLELDDRAPSVHGDQVWLGCADSCDLLRSLLGADPRIHVLGPMTYGSLWSYRHHAFACIDFGFPPEWARVANNCKVLDLVRAGSRIAAEGWSPTHYLIDKYNAGGKVPYGDTAALIRMLASWQPEPVAVKQRRGTEAAIGESWLARMPMILAAIDAIR